MKIRKELVTEVFQFIMDIMEEPTKKELKKIEPVVSHIGIKSRLQVEFVLDLHFWAILPAINLNFHSKTLEFEWLCLAIYIEKCRYTPEN